jgi:hypothetical protein
MAGQQHAGLSALGVGVSVAALAALTVEELDARGVEISARGLVPNSHLLAGPFSVPPALFAKKWIVLRSSATARCTELMNLAVHFQGGSWRQLRARFRDPTNSTSEWQATACGATRRTRRLDRFDD